MFCMKTPNIHLYPAAKIMTLTMDFHQIRKYWKWAKIWAPPEGQALGCLVRSTLPAPHENVAVQALGNLLCPAKQGCRLSVFSFLPHHHYIRTGHTYFIALKTINMPPSKPPVQNPVDIPFENGIILTTSINLITCRHSIQRDLHMWGYHWPWNQCNWFNYL